MFPDPGPSRGHDRVRGRNGRDPVDGRQLRLHEEAPGDPFFCPNLRLLGHVGGSQRHDCRRDPRGQVSTARDPGGVGLRGSGRGFRDPGSITVGSSSEVSHHIMIAANTL